MRLPYLLKYSCLKDHAYLKIKWNKEIFYLNLKVFFLYWNFTVTNRNLFWLSVAIQVSLSTFQESPVVFSLNFDLTISFFPFPLFQSCFVGLLSKMESLK